MANPFTSAQAPQTLQLIAPDIAAQQMQLMRQQQMADILRSNALAPSGGTQMAGQYAIKNSPFEGISKMAQALLGGFAQRNIDEKNLDLAKSLQERYGNILGGGSGGSPEAPKPVMPGQLGSGMMDAANPNIAPQAQTGSEPVPMGAGVPVMPQAVTSPRPQAQQPQGNFNIGNLIRGQVIGQLGGDAAAKTYWEQYAPTEATKQALSAGTDPMEANKGALFKSNFVPPTQARAGSVMIDPKTGRPTAYNPHIPEGFNPVYDASGNVVSVKPVEGALDAMQASTRATAAGKASVEPIAGYDANGKPVFTNKLTASGGATNTPSSLLGNAPTSDSGRFGGYTPAGVSGGAVAPGLAAGVSTAAEGMASQNTKRSGALIDSAADSPVRVNVLDNIVNLSKSGVDTGPTADFVNNMKGYAANIPGFGAWKDDVTGFQEIKKYLSQNGIRAWQAAGGTGTDSQMSAAMQANPNDKMFPKAVQDMATWAKAGELALQSKASAQDDWLGRNANNPQAQNQFESTWRKNFDPRIYQMKLMDQNQLGTFVSKIPEKERGTLIQKYQTAKQNGWIQ